MEEDVEEDQDDTMPIYDEAYDEEEFVYADQGESLMVSRNLSATHIEDDSWLHHNIFHTRCTSHGKVCNVIIDGGSCKNVVATMMVEKLKLKTVPHPQPYRLSWLKKDSEIKVN